jgi:uncharacterized phiE125 gp8 family phage protein
MYNVTKFTQTVAPTVEPLTLTETKLHLRVDHSDDDTLITRLIEAARQYCETYTGRAFVPRTNRADLAGFYSEINLGDPVSSATIQYYDTASPSVLTTLSATVYQLHQGVIQRRFGETYPAVATRPDAVQITYVAGYQPTSIPITDWAESVPSAIKVSMLLLIGDMYENREAQIIGTIVAPNRTVKLLLDPYRLYI